jgi:PIN like domain
MRVLLDECVPRPLRRELAGHDVQTVQELGWAGKRNGELIALIRTVDHDAFVTTDQRLEYQQNIAAAQIPLIVLVSQRNTLQGLLPLVPKLRLSLRRIRPGQIVHIGV